MLDIITIQITPDEARMIKTALVTRAMNFAQEDKSPTLMNLYTELYEKVQAQTTLGGE